MNAVMKQRYGQYYSFNIMTLPVDPSNPSKMRSCKDKDINRDRDNGRDSGSENRGGAVSTGGGSSTGGTGGNAGGVGGVGGVGGPVVAREDAAQARKEECQ